MQIRELVLYGYNGQIRHLTFKLGEVNIITGKSQSGKSVIGDIIDYCLGGTSCNIADGKVRDNVSWYGLLLQLDSEQIFVARKNPDHGDDTTAYCYIEIGESVEIPHTCQWESNANVIGLEEILSRRIGISENIHRPPEGQSRLAVSANIRHALYYCFQKQTEIATNESLFHKQSEDFITQTIRDTIPYFLGIVSEEALALVSERSILTRQRTLEKRKLGENQELIGGGLQRAISLLSEAKAVGLISTEVEPDYNDYPGLTKLLQGLTQWQPTDIYEVGMDRLTYLQSGLEYCYQELEEIESNIFKAKKFIDESSGYEEEASQQRVRLESIGLFEQLNFNNGMCPFCSGVLTSPLPSIEMVKASILNLDKAIANVTREKPRLQEFITGLEQERQRKQEEISNIKSEIDGIYEQQEESQKIKDLNSRRARVIGRVSLWVESVRNDVDYGKSEQKILELESRLKEIEQLLDRDSVEERKQSILSRMQIDMTEWAKELQLEHSGNPYRLDLKQVTVVVDKAERPVPLRQLGSGANWVGVHLITYFALQKFFIDANRPVPRFLFLDQPSQVYFPSESGKKKTDWYRVRGIYDFIFKRVEEMKEGLQVIIVDHANFDDVKFKDHILENWHDEENLIPREWYQG